MDKRARVALPNLPPPAIRPPSGAAGAIAIGRPGLPETQLDDKIKRLRIRVTLDGKTYDEDLGLQADVQMSYDGLNRALAEHPARFAWWATLETLARARHEELEAQLKELDATLFGKYQEDLASIGTNARGEQVVKDPTLDRIKAAVTLDTQRQTLAASVASAKRDLEQLTVGRQTMQQRKDVLLAIASNWRAEMDYQLMVGQRSLREQMR